MTYFRNKYNPCLFGFDFGKVCYMLYFKSFKNMIHEKNIQENNTP